MKVKQLIKQLQKCDPNKEVTFSTFCGTAAGCVKKTQSAGFYGHKKPYKKVVTLSCLMEYYEGNKC